MRVLAIALIAIALVTVRVIWSSRIEWRAALATSGDERLVHLGRAARLYAPGNPYSQRALLALTDEARVADEAGQTPAALAAWREVRSAILATRSFYTPHRYLLDEANREIAARMAKSEDESRGPEAARLAWHAARLAQDESPSVLFTVLALLGLFGYIASAVCFFLRAVDERDRIRRGPALLWAGGIVLGLTLFFLGLARA